MKRFVVNKKIASVALSSAMVISNVGYIPTTVNAEVVQNVETVETTETAEMAEVVETTEVSVDSSEEVSEEISILPAIEILTANAFVTPVVTSATVEPTVVTGANTMTSTSGLNWNFNQTGGTITTPASCDYLLFPETTDNYVLTGDFKITSVEGGEAGVIAGVFDGGTATPTMLTGVGANGSSQAYGYYSDTTGVVKPAGMNEGNGSYTPTAGDKISFTVKKDAASGVVFSFIVNDGTLYTKNIGYQHINTLIADGVSNRYGLAFGGVNATVSNLLLKDSTGVTLYDQSTAFVANGTAPVVGTVTVNANEAKTAVTADWTTTTEATGDGAFKVELSVNNGEYVVLSESTTSKTITVSTSEYGEGTYKFRVSGFLGATTTTAKEGSVTVEFGEVNPYAPKKYEFLKDSLNVQTEGYRDILTETNAAGNIYSTSSTDAIKMSSYLFPATKNACKLEFEIKPGTTPTPTGTSQGITMGLFNGADGTLPTLFAGGAGRGSAFGLTGLYSKGTGAAGTGGTSGAYNLPTTEYTKVLIERTDAGTYVKFYAKGSDSPKVSVGLANNNVFNGGTGWTKLDNDARLGIGFANTSATIRNVKYYETISGTETLLYDANSLRTPAGDMPVISKVNDIVPAANCSSISTSWETTTPATGDAAYKVELSTDGGTSYTVLDNFCESTSYTHPISDSGDYKFKITGVLGSQVGTSVESNTKFVQGALKASTLSYPTFGDKSVNLSWTAVTDAEGYDIFRRTADETSFSTTPFAHVSGGSTITYTDTAVENEMPYYYYVLATSSSNPNAVASNTVFGLPNAGRTGEYVYEDEACKIALTNKSNDTSLTGEATLEGTVDRAGTLDLMVGGSKVDTKSLAANGTFDFDFTLAEGRNDVNLIFTDASGKKTRETFNFVHLTNYDIVVDQSYTGDNGDEDSVMPGAKVYKKVGDAIAAIEAGRADGSLVATDKVVVFIKNGKYDSKTKTYAPYTEYLTVKSPNVTFVGEDRENTKIEYDTVGNGFTNMTARAAFRVDAAATDFTAENLTFRNSFDYKNAIQNNTTTLTQGDALDVAADKAIFVNTKLDGYQDTLHATQGKQYYYKCRIEGLVDFIYGDKNGQALFEDTDIIFKYYDKKPQGYITAPKHDTTQSYGYTFNNCRILSEKVYNPTTGEYDQCTGTKYSLGRPYGPNAYVVFIDTYMPQIIGDGDGFSDWSGGASASAARFYEHGSYGPGFKVDARRRQLSETQANNFLSNTTLGWAPADNSQAVSTANYIGIDVQPVVATVNAPTISTDGKYIKLNWTASTEASSGGGYKVEVSTDGGSTYTTVGRTAAKSYAYKFPADGTYKFRITGVLSGSADGASVASSEIAAVVPNIQPTVSVASAELSADKTSIDVAWDSDTEAYGKGGYKVEVSVDNGDYTVVNALTKDLALTYPVTADGVYKFRITGLLEGNADTASKETSEILVDTSVQPIVTTVATDLSDDRTTIDVSWNAAPVSKGRGGYRVEVSIDDADYVVLEDLLKETSYTYQVPADGKYKFRITGVLEGVADSASKETEVVTVDTAVVATSITPETQLFNYNGSKAYNVTVTGNNLTVDNIYLAVGDNKYKPVSATQTEANFVLEIAPNTSTKEAVVTVYTVVVNDTPSTLTTTVTVGKAPATDNTGTGSGGGSTINKKPLPSKPTAPSTPKTEENGATETPTTETKPEAKPEAKIETKEAPAVVAEKATEYSEANKDLLAKTYSEVKVDKVDNKPVTLKYDLSGVELSDTDKASMVAVRIDPETGEVTYLGGRLDEATNTFVTDTKVVDGDFAVIVADPSLYNQVTFKINETATSVNGETKQLEAAPQIVEGTTFMPVRAVSEALGAEVSYNALTKTATVTIDGVSSSFKVGESQNGEPATFVENGRILIPVRAVSEALGANVNWFAADKTIQVTK